MILCAMLVREIFVSVFIMNSRNLTVKAANLNLIAMTMPLSDLRPDTTSRQVVAILLSF
jgi:hypothetical protein